MSQYIWIIIISISIFFIQKKINEDDNQSLFNKLDYFSINPQKAHISKLPENIKGN